MFRWHDCLEGHVLLGIAFEVAALVLLILTTFSTPYITSIFFLSLPDHTRFGSFGYCTDQGCTPHTVGYEVGPEVIAWLTRTHILLGVAAGLVFLALLALILSLFRVGQFMWNPVYFRTLALLASLFAILAEIFALICWVTARQRYNAEGVDARYGAALWLGLAGAMAAFLG